MACRPRAHARSPPQELGGGVPEPGGVKNAEGVTNAEGVSRIRQTPLPPNRRESSQVAATRDPCRRYLGELLSWGGRHPVACGRLGLFLALGPKRRGQPAATWDETEGDPGSPSAAAALERRWKAGRGRQETAIRRRRRQVPSMLKNKEERALAGVLGLPSGACSCASRPLARRPAGVEPG